MTFTFTMIDVIGNMEKSKMGTEWWMKGRTGEYLRDCVEQRIYNAPNPDWSGLQEDAKRAELSYSEVYEFLRNVREEG
jgi:hypothetical protein